MIRLKQALFGLLVLYPASVTLAHAGNCSPQRAEDLLTLALHNEANPTLASQAAVTAVVFNRVDMPKWNADTVCEVLNQPNQFDMRQKRRDAAKYASSRRAARIFLREKGKPLTERAIFIRLRGMDSFKTAKGTRGRPVIGGNEFHRS